jgi:hypothetical protein
MPITSVTCSIVTIFLISKHRVEVQPQDLDFSWAA